MPNPHPQPYQRRDGVRTFEDLKQRCFVDEGDDPCWHWRGARTTHERPSLWVAELKSVRSLGAAICFLKTGKTPKPGAKWHCICDTRDCANPAHRREGTARSAGLRAKRPDSLAVLRMTISQRARSQISEEVVREIRESTCILREAAARYGVHISTVSKIRRGEMRKPLMTRNASVFHQGIA